MALVFHMFRAADTEPCCRQVLLQHAEGSVPDHVQGNLLDRAPEKELEVLKRLISKSVQQCRAERGRKMLKRGKASKKEFGRGVFKKALAVAKRMKFSKSAHCFRCNRLCAVHPPRSLRQQYDHYFIIARTTCVSWSSMGRSAGWVHESAIPFVCWLANWLPQSPTHVLHECTRNFDVQALRSAVEPRYLLQQVICSPLNFGVPVHRKRSYCLLTLKSKIVVEVPWQLSSVEDLLFAEVRVSAKVFFRAPSSFVTHYMTLHQRPEREAEAETLARKCLTMSQVTRLDEHILGGLADDKAFLWVAYSQNKSFMSFDEFVPALTTSATIWGKNMRDAGGVDRMMMPIELIAAQGWAVLLDVTDEKSSRLPMPLRYRNVARWVEGVSVRAADMVKMAGNGMHVSQVGACLLYALLGTRKKEAS